MNIIEFEVSGQQLKRIDSQQIMNKNINRYKCKFVFEDESEWIELNKFAIFEDGWRNQAVAHLGVGDEIECLVPQKVLRGSYFKVSLYAGEFITTNSITVALIQSGYPRRVHSIRENDIFSDIFKQLDATVDNITYGNHNLYLYHQEECLDTIYLPFVLEEDFERMVENLIDTYVVNVFSQRVLSDIDREKFDSIEYGANKIIIDTELNENSDNPLGNKIIVRELGKNKNIERLDEIIIDLINNGE